jgi:hypothetical protein
MNQVRGNGAVYNAQHSGHDRRAAGEQKAQWLRRFVQQGKNQPSPWESLKNQIYLGSDQFVEDMQCKINPKQSLSDIPRKQKQSTAKHLSYYEQRYPRRNEAMAYAYLSSHYTLAEVGKWFGVSYATVSRAVKAIECKM